MKKLIEILESVDSETKKLNLTLVKLQWLIVSVNVVNIITIIVIFIMLIR